MMASTSEAVKPRFPLWLIPFGLICLLIGLGFIVLHLLSPSDGARFAGGEKFFSTNGVVVSPYELDQGNLRQGDVVTAVEGQSFETWVRSLFTLGAPRPNWQVGDEITYRIERGGQTMDQKIVLGPLPFEAILANYWGVLLFAFVSQVVALFVLVRKPSEPAARAFFIWALSGSHSYAWSFFLQVGDVTSVIGFWWFHLATPLLWLLYWPAGLHMALVFPRSIPVVERRRWIIPMLYAGSLTAFFLLVGWNWSRSQELLPWINSWHLIANSIAGPFLAATIGVIFYKYRRTSTLEEKVKIRWAVYGAIIPGLIGLIFWILLPMISDESILSPNLLGLIMLLFPISIAIAIVRYQLFDIDHIIRRTLVYGVLTAALLGIYFLSVILLQQIIRGVTGAISPLAIVVSTLLIAALFNPLRGWLQEGIDRRFYRSKYDARQALNAFAATARDEVELEQITAELLQLVEQTMQPESLSLWLKDTVESSLKTN